MGVAGVFVVSAVLVVSVLMWMAPIIPALTNRGFTGYEHIDEMGLIHMNGRVYDPQIGRFLSADPYIQSSYKPLRLSPKAVYAMRSTMLPCPSVMVSIEPRLS
jgi:RHS repeat-associated protein